jgi:plastocyanin
VGGEREPPTLRQKKIRRVFSLAACSEDLMLSLRLAVVSTILVFAIACGSGSSTPSPSPTPTPTPTPSPTPAPGGASSSVTIPVGAESLGDRAYTPDDLNVTVGTTVTWTNTDSVSHTSTSDATGWNSGAVAPGGQFSFAFQTGGTFPYHCSIHPGMVGRVVVR